MYLFNKNNLTLEIAFLIDKNVLHVETKSSYFWKVFDIYVKNTI